MIEIKMLSSADENDLRTAFEWERSAPQWFSDAQETWKETFEEFLANIENELLYGVYDDDIRAVIRLIPAGNNIYCAHLMAKGIDFEVLLSAAKSIQAYLFDNGVKGFYGWIPSLNRSVIKLYKELGFTDSLIKCYKGATRGKAIEWRKMIKN